MYTIVRTTHSTKTYLDRNDLTSFTIHEMAWVTDDLVLAMRLLKSIKKKTDMTAHCKIQIESYVRKDRY